MLDMDKTKREKYESNWIGKDVEVLVEEQIMREGKPYQVGHTKEYIKVLIDSEESLQNQFLTVHLKDNSQIIH